MNLPVSELRIDGIILYALFGYVFGVFCCNIVLRFIHVAARGHTLFSVVYHSTV